MTKDGAGTTLDFQSMGFLVLFFFRFSWFGAVANEYLTLHIDLDGSFAEGVTHFF